MMKRRNNSRETEPSKTIAVHRAVAEGFWGEPWETANPEAQETKAQKG